MLLSINEAKVAELMKSSSSGYTVNSLELPMNIDNRQIEPVIVEVSGISYGLHTEAQPREEAAFGTHVREALEIVKDWAGNKQK